MRPRKKMIFREAKNKFMGSENSKKGSITLLGDTWMWNGDYHL
jgi:hypothetical protein